MQFKKIALSLIAALALATATPVKAVWDYASIMGAAACAVAGLTLTQICTDYLSDDVDDQLHTYANPRFFKIGNTLKPLNTQVSAGYTYVDGSVCDDGYGYHQEWGQLIDATDVASASQVYKIHLMPHESHIDYVMGVLLTALNNGQLTQNVNNKIMIKYRNDYLKQDGHAMPMVVIYALGKDDAQQLLNEVYALLKRKNGMNITPRFNARVNSMIYVAQGHGDDKIKPEKADYFIAPEKIYLNAKKLSNGSKQKDFYLKHPETGAYLMTDKTVNRSFGGCYEI